MSRVCVHSKDCTTDPTQKKRSASQAFCGAALSWTFINRAFNAKVCPPPHRMGALVDTFTPYAPC